MNGAIVALYSMVAILVLVVVYKTIDAVLTFLNQKKDNETVSSLTVKDNYEFKLMGAGLLAIISIVIFAFTVMTYFPFFEVFLFSTLGSLQFIVIIGLIFEIKMEIGDFANK